MIFKYIVLTLSQDYDDFSKEEAYPFHLKSFSLCDFIERRISKLRYNTEGFNQFSIRGFKGKAFANEYINDSNVLCIYLDNFDYKKYEKIDKNNVKELNEYYIDLLFHGLELAKKYNLPEKEIIEAVEEFRENNYVNQWIFKKKRIVGKKSYCFLECKITTNEFKLELFIEQEGKEVYRQTIVEDLPDSITTSYHFGDLKVSKEGIIEVTSLRKKVIFTLDVNEILK